MSRPDPIPEVRKRTLGPISDLERHLPPNWWRDLFNAMYLKTDGDVVENVENTRLDIDLVLQLLGLETHDRVLDLCCGQGRHSIELASRGYQKVVGIDQSRFLIRLARRRAKSAGVEITFREGDARKFRLPAESVNVALLMGNSFGYFDEAEDDLAVLKSVFRALRSGGRLLIDLCDGEWTRENFAPRSWEWIDSQHFVCRERSLSSCGERLISREVVVHAENGVLIDQFYAERLYTPEKITKLLERAGFERIIVHGGPDTLSARNQDLGMMEHRFIATAIAPQKRPLVVSTTQRKVTVLLGDPKLPDGVNPDMNGPEDVEARDRMKAALAELSGYNCHYLSNHASMLAELRSEPPEFVLNFCDEGYGNNPDHELHIPAILELLGISYSGAGPGCLALCYNKSHVNAIASGIGIPVPAECYVGPDDGTASLPTTFPALLKPVCADGSYGITKRSVVHNTAELMDCFTRLRSAMPHEPILVQEFLSGREFSVAIIGNPGVGYRVLPLLEVDYSGLPAGLPKILGFESKWLPDSPYWTAVSYRQADLPLESEQRLVHASKLLFERLDCRDYARFDFRTGADGTIKLLEVNPNPGWVWDGKFNLMAGFDGLRYAEMLELILDAAIKRIAGRPAARAVTGGYELLGG